LRSVDHSSLMIQKHSTIFYRIQYFFEKFL
jgi:hypothetical protein